MRRVVFWLAIGRTKSLVMLIMMRSADFDDVRYFDNFVRFVALLIAQMKIDNRVGL